MSLSPISGFELNDMGRSRIGPHGRAGAVLIAVLLGMFLGGCAQPFGTTRPPLTLRVTAPIEIPPQRAHAILQGGRLANYGNRTEPYCELEVRQVSGDEPQWVRQGEFQVGRISQQVLIDPTTRIPDFLVTRGCSDPVFQESVWWLESRVPSEVLFLRCIAPYFDCHFGPPLSVDQVQQVVGDYLSVGIGEPLPGIANPSAEVSTR
ncbi:hypothetical protein ThidrDRAFT_1936 [Thiorhodococcus drewsii AZ1]|uniref:Uncharacterized protein n=1 Tax=Thiorhodococcus drewsii AZ1 TaxID=765913 RepID=G2E0W3_9GAMM|nr:hypothetical protein [Thiorhodococcus drewsii]EGV31735.1 hypothetical protein ThidrDRAFT_1936 [Thiorhodococcus drewsii AZ1]